MSRSRWLGRRLDAAVRTFNLNPWTRRRLALIPRGDADWYSEDRLVTPHTHAFTEDPRFQRAYQRAVRAGGFDYGIRWRAHTVLWAAQLSADRNGAFVECGTGRGFMMSDVCDYLDWTDRPFYLFDTFKRTLPDERGVQAPDGQVSRHYASTREAAAENFAEWPGVRIVMGEIPATLAQTHIEQVAFLHVDMNHPRPEEAAIRHFWPRMGGRSSHGP